MSQEDQAMTDLSPTPPKTTVELPFPPGWSSAKGCSHGKLWEEACDECEAISLAETIKWMEPQVRRAKARLAKCAQDNVGEQARHGDTLIELEQARRSLAERDADVKANEVRIGELETDLTNCMSLAAIRADRIAALEARNAALVGALQSYANGRCYPCGWPLKATVEEGCIIGNCSYRPSERAHDYQQWHDRSELLSAALTEQRENRRCDHCGNYECEQHQNEWQRPAEQQGGK